MTDAGTGGAAPSGIRKRLSDGRRREILLAAVGVVTERGYDAASVDEIAAAAGTSKATLYRHWTDKPTLIVTALMETSELDLARIDTGTLAGDLDALIAMMTVRTGANTALVLTLAEAGRHDGRLRSVFARTVLPELRLLHGMCERAVRRGEIVRPDRVDYVPHLLVGMLFTAPLLDGAAAATPESLRSYVDAVILPYLTASA